MECDALIGKVDFQGKGGLSDATEADGVSVRG